MPSRPRQVWGRPMSEYFSRDPAHAFFPECEIPPISHVKTTIIPQLEQMCKPSQNICTLLWSVLSLLCDPKELRSLDNTVLLSRCILALRSFTDDTDPQANKLFSYEYGFLCFRAIVLIMHVGVLAQTTTFDSFLEENGNLSDPSQVSAALSDFVMDVMLERWDISEPRDFLLSTSPTHEGVVLLETIGGFFSNDAIFLLKILWQDRKGFMEICTQTSAAGWILPLMLVEEHVHWALKAGSTNREHWIMVQGLCLRYSLIAPVDELGFLETICTKAVVYNGQLKSTPGKDACSATSLVDLADARVILQACFPKMTVSAQQSFPHILTTMSDGFIRQEEIIFLSDLMPSLIKISCSWIWEQIDDLSCSSKNPAESHDLLRFATETLGTIGQLYVDYCENPTEIVSALDKALAESDFMNLFGKLVFLPLSIGTSISQRADGDFETFDDISDSNDPNRLARIWSRLVDKALCLDLKAKRGASINSRPILHSFYADWLKTWRCFNLKFPQHNIKSRSLEYYIHSCFLSFFGFGDSLGFWLRKERTKLQCAYPRCPASAFESDPQFLCARCLDASYCSHLCQTKDWAALTGRSHRELCNRV